MDYIETSSQKSFLLKKLLSIQICKNNACKNGAFSEIEKYDLAKILNDKYDVKFHHTESCPSCESNKIDIEISSIFKDLTFKEFKILGLFINTPEHSLSRQNLISSLWTDVKVGPKTLDVHLFNLRRKIRPKGYDLIHQGTGIWKLEKF